MKAGYFCASSMLAVAMTMSAAHAAAAADQPPAATVSEVVVTGSFIAGTPENAALPVTVLNADTLSKQGSPTAVEMLKALPEANSSILGYYTLDKSGELTFAEQDEDMTCLSLGQIAVPFPDDPIMVKETWRDPLWFTADLLGRTAVCVDARHTFDGDSDSSPD